MPEHDFQREVIDRLARIETKQDATMNTVNQHSDTLQQHGERITATESSSRSAHKRIDGIFACAGVVGGVAGWVANLLVSIWPNGGGHG